MLRILLWKTSNKALGEIVSKYLTKIIKKQGLNGKATIEDFVMYEEENGDIRLHIVGDLTVSQTELLDFLDEKTGEL